MIPSRECTMVLVPEPTAINRVPVHVTPFPCAKRALPDAEPVHAIPSTEEAMTLAPFPVAIHIEPMEVTLRPTVKIDVPVSHVIPSSDHMTVELPPFPTTTYRLLDHVTPLPVPIRDEPDVELAQLSPSGE